MAGGSGAWGIDIGQSGLKALRATVADDGEAIVAEAFDYIEYPKILSQPDADPDQLVRDALQEFLSRNDLRGDSVAISVSGQSGLARFIKLPPVDKKKIPDIVKYEAKQQIPFELDDVVWDYQPMPGSDEEEGFALDTEVGLFAMKRDQVVRFIRPLVDAEVELDVIQLTPLCIYNALAFDAIRPSEAEKESGKLPASVVILSLGTETSDLVVTNGIRLWQRSVPIGGNHFTKQVTKELKLTFAKAEHLKRNARDAEDAKKVYQAMRPVFNDLVTEIQRSLGFFRSLDRAAEISHMLVMGNAVKLPGLPQYLEKSLSMEVKKFDRFNRLHGLSVLDAPAFKENVLAFPVCYGLVLQGLKLAQLSTNLVPREILTQRLIRRKKPWAAAIAATILLACALNYFSHWSVWETFHPDNPDSNGVTWGNTSKLGENLTTKSQGHVTTDDSQQEDLTRLHELGSAAVGSADGRLLWLELLRAITESLPVDMENAERKIFTADEKPFEQRQEIYIDRIESEFFQDISEWFTDVVQEKYEQGRSVRMIDDDGDELAASAGEAVEDPSAGAVPGDGGVPPAGGTDLAGNGMASDGMASDDEPIELTGSGWVIDIHGHHFRPQGEPGSGPQYVRTTLLEKLDTGSVELPMGSGNLTVRFTLREMGISYPYLLSGNYTRSKRVMNPNYKPPDDGRNMGGLGYGEGPGAMGIGSLGISATEPAEEDPNNKRYYTPARYEFVLQFCWKQLTLTERIDAREKDKAESTNIASNAGTGGI